MIRVGRVLTRRCDRRNFFTYDHTNQPTTASLGATGVYEYDANLKRIKTVTGGGETIYSFYSWVTGNVIYRHNVTNWKRTDYVAAGAANLRLIEGATPEYTHFDHLGSALAASDANAIILWREAYSPFGRKRLDPPANRDDMGYTGHIQDDITDLTYMQARYYDPIIGRFLSTDPIGYEGGDNLYAYAYNDPTNRTDPTGLRPPDNTDPEKDQSTRDMEMAEALVVEAETAAIMEENRAKVDDHMDNGGKWEKGRDKRYHCQANCEAAQKGNAHEDAARRQSDFRENYQQQSSGATAEDAAADQAANTRGREYGRENPGGQCRAMCGGEYGYFAGDPEVDDNDEN